MGSLLSCLSSTKKGSEPADQEYWPVVWQFVKENWTISFSTLFDSFERFTYA